MRAIMGLKSPDEGSIHVDDIDFWGTTSGERERLKQNEVQEKLTAQWIDHCLKQLSLRRSA